MKAPDAKEGPFLPRWATIAIFLSVGSLLLGCSLRRAGTVDSLTDQQGLVNAVAEVTAEISAIRAERDSFTGLTYQSTLPVGLAMLLAWQSWLSHKREISRLTRGGLK